MDINKIDSDDVQDMTKQDITTNEKQCVSQKKVDGNESEMNSGVKRKYDAITENGDTLELSEQGKNSTLISNKKIISDVKSNISDGVLGGYSKAKLKQLYAKKEISKQQYDRAMNKKEKSGIWNKCESVILK